MALTGPANAHRQPSDPPSLVGPAATFPSDRAEIIDSHVSPVTLSDAQARESFQWLADLAVEQLPRTYTGDSDWGDTKKLWAGVKVRRDGWKLKTHRRFRELRHGRWTRYTITLPADDQPDRVATDICSVECDAQGRWRIDSTITAPMVFKIRRERWNLGIQWYSISVTGVLRVTLHSTATIGFLADYSEVPPTLCVDPRIEQAQLVLERFEVERISKVGGDAAEEMGEVMETLIRDLWLEKQNERLADKLNRSIDRRKEDLRWSLADWFSE